MLATDDITKPKAPEDDMLSTQPAKKPTAGAGAGIPLADMGGMSGAAPMLQAQMKSPDPMAFSPAGALSVGGGAPLTGMAPAPTATSPTPTTPGAQLSPVNASQMTASAAPPAAPSVPNALDLWGQQHGGGDRYGDINTGGVTTKYDNFLDSYNKTAARRAAGGFIAGDEEGYNLDDPALVAAVQQAQREMDANTAGANLNGGFTTMGYGGNTTGSPNDTPERKQQLADINAYALAQLNGTSNPPGTPSTPTTPTNPASGGSRDVEEQMLQEFGRGWYGAGSPHNSPEMERRYRELSGQSGGGLRDIAPRDNPTGTTPSTPTNPSYPNTGSATGTGGSTGPFGGPSGVQGVDAEGINPDDSLIGKQLTPSNTVDRNKVFQDSLNSTIENVLNPAYDARLRDLNRYNFGAGRGVSGTARTSMGDVASDYGRQIADLTAQGTAGATIGSIDDMYRNLDELQQERGHQKDLSDTAFGQSVTGAQLEDLLTNSAFGRAERQSNAGEANNPSDVALILSQIFGGQSSAAGDAAARLFSGMGNRSGEGGSGGGSGIPQWLLDLIPGIGGGGGNRTTGAEDIDYGGTPV